MLSIIEVSLCYDKRILIIYFPILDDIEFIKSHKKTSSNSYLYEVKFAKNDNTVLTADLDSKLIDSYWKWFNNKSTKKYFSPLQKPCLMVDNKATRSLRIHCISSKSICQEKPSADSYFCEIHKYDNIEISSGNKN